ncbi:PHP domain-containing protein [Mycoavidus cysteinexigens]|uniref:PHP domain-containing protein n=1 Tax=Mycoavidus cysteinexigens TaxID=1553431 RepID=A0A2Z6EWA1_9BURK|nr:3',5'-nucleoside bisphosphate phosphatase [Mycoavidus cysteinexigens]BBE09365.1 PHP domain-containing protein [Mycoavidus cysteinexigens]GLR01951.1 phosphatase [Mycoavidus cysteinexigens]
MLNADLHCHSNCSDGVLTPAEVARYAYAGGVKLWSLTDHDELSGQHAAHQAATALGMQYVCGVEISVTWAERTVHVVGLNFNPDCAALVNGLAEARRGRVARAQAMATELAKVGIKDAYAGALRYASNPDLIARTHFARYLVEAGFAPSLPAVFKRYLIEGHPGFVPHCWAQLTDAISWINAAGGVAVLAHPGRYRFTPREFEILLTTFKELGGKAIEVITGSHTKQQYQEYAQIARHYGFWASRGSDFHAPKESRTALGSLPALPADLTPVWHAWL